jgi:hypothetical protein
MGSKLFISVEGSAMNDHTPDQAAAHELMSELRTRV